MRIRQTIKLYTVSHPPAEKERTLQSSSDLICIYEDSQAGNGKTSRNKIGKQQARKLQATPPSPKLRLTNSLTRWRGWSEELLQGDQKQL